MQGLVLVLDLFNINNHIHKEVRRTRSYSDPQKKNKTKPSIPSPKGPPAPARLSLNTFPPSSASKRFQPDPRQRSD
jgi:hypothetical protein